MANGPTPLYNLRIDLIRTALELREDRDGRKGQAIARKIEKLGRKLEKAIGGMPVDRTPDEQMTKFLDGVIGCVEANSNERCDLWDRNDRREPEHKKVWTSDNSGLMTCVDIIADNEVWISLSTATIGGHKILFYHATSLVVHHGMVKDWLKARLPKTAFDGERLNNVDAQNFHNVFPYEPPKQETAP